MGRSLVTVGSTKPLSLLLASLSALEVVAENDNVVANKKKDMQNNFFMNCSP
jgi:hypothetical protein